MKCLQEGVRYFAFAVLIAIVVSSVTCAPNQPAPPQCSEIKCQAERNCSAIVDSDGCASACNCTDCPAVRCSQGCRSLMGSDGCPGCICTPCPTVRCAFGCVPAQDEEGCYSKCKCRYCDDVACDKNCVAMGPDGCPMCRCPP